MKTNVLISCTLLARVAICVHLLPATAQDASRTTSPQNQPMPFEAVDRITVHRPEEPLRLGEKNILDITLKGPPILCLEIIQGSERSGGSMAENGGCVPVQHRQDGSTYVEVIPESLGETAIGFMAVFADRGLETEALRTTVIAPHPPLKLEVAFMAKDKSMEFMIVGEQKRFEVRADFAGLKDPLYIPTKDVQYRVIQLKRPVIQYDQATGKFVAQRIGDALVETSFGGAKQTTCVMVREHQGYTPENCDELRQGGDGILPPGQDADAPGADWHSRLPYTAGREYQGRFFQDERMGRFLADERLEIVQPGHPLKIAEYNSITLKVRGAKVARVECNHNCVPVPAMKYRPTMDFQEQSDGSIVVSLFPWEPGSVHYDFAVFFADGGVAHKTLVSDVVFGSKQPRGINLSCGSDSYQDPNVPRYLTVSQVGQAIIPPGNFWIDACYEGIRSLVLLPPELVTYRILGNDKQPVMTVDSSSGRLTGLRSGAALLQREFHGLKTETCIIVLSPGDRPEDHKTDCSALRARYGLPVELPQMINPHY